LKETLRLFPIFGITSRVAADDAEIEGHVIKKGSHLILHFQSLQAQGWPDAKRFDISRWDKTTPCYKSTAEARRNCLPFGAGHRRCPAEKFSKILIKSILLHLFRYVDIHISPGFLHTRYLQHGVPVLLVKKNQSVTPEQLRLQLDMLVRRTPRHEIEGYKWLSPRRVIGTVIRDILVTRKISKECFYPIIIAFGIWKNYLFDRFIPGGRREWNLPK
jgi:hypothetical protein